MLPNNEKKTVQQPIHQIQKRAQIDYHTWPSARMAGRWAVSLVRMSPCRRVEAVAVGTIKDLRGWHGVP